MTHGFSNEGIFHEMRMQFRNSFVALSQDLKEKADKAIASQLDVIQGDLDILRHENVATESESNPKYRQRVEKEVNRVRTEMANIIGRVSPADRSYRSTGNSYKFNVMIDCKP